MAKTRFPGDFREKEMAVAKFVSGRVRVSPPLSSRDTAIKGASPKLPCTIPRRIHQRTAFQVFQCRDELASRCTVMRRKPPVTQSRYQYGFSDDIGLPELSVYRHLQGHQRGTVTTCSPFKCLQPVISHSRYTDEDVGGTWSSKVRWISVHLLLRPAMLACLDWR